MDITTFTSEFNQYTLIQKKLFLDWIKLPIENDEEEEARQRFIYSLDNPNDSDYEDKFNEIEINERFNSFITPGSLERRDFKSLYCKFMCGRLDKTNGEYFKCYTNCMET
jgi:hypothetical protein